MRRWLTLGGLLSGPLLWLGLAYLGSLAVLLARSLFQRDELSNKLITSPTIDHLKTVATGEVYRSTTLRTVGVAVAVTVLDLALALPMSLYMAKLARPTLRRVMVAGVLMPLWASYVVKSYAWRALLDPVGGVFRKTLGVSPGFGLAATTLTLAYLWLPYMVLPVYAGLERVPDSLIEASSDLGGKSGRTFVSVVLPILRPAILAGSIFTFSLTLGDYIAPSLVGGPGSSLIGTVVAR